MNILRKAAAAPDLAKAIAILQVALGLTNKELAIGLLPADYRWAKFSEAGRLKAIADYLRAECFDAMDLVDAPTPMETVGTND